ncbi:MAG: hypothetical protein ACK5OX_17820 [Desertimonas sp.]
MRTVPAATVDSALRRSPFMVVAFSSRSGPRSAGVVPEYDAGAMWFGSLAGDFKIRCIERAPEVSVTVTVPTRIPFLGAVVPPATITFAGRATVMPADGDGVPHHTAHPKLTFPDDTGPLAAVRIEPTSDLVSYGVGIPVWKMTNIGRARGRTDLATWAGRQLARR